MAHYRLRVQLINWYELIVSADSAEDAVPKAEALSPRQIAARGKRIQMETGLADPGSVKVVDEK